MVLPIKGMQKTSLIDYPPYVVSTLFVGYCDFRCPYCQNVDLVKQPKRLPTLPEQEILRFLESRKRWLDGVCITGGEPCIHKDLPNFIVKVKRLGLKVKLDTNGTNPGMIRELIDKKLVDYIAMDIKAPLEKYDKVAKVKVSKKDIQKSINIMRASGIKYEFRTTVVPDLLTKKDILAIAKWLKGSKKYFLQQFRSDKGVLDKSYKNKKPYPSEELKKMADLARPYFEICEVRGI
jgi:pyruvate formate lyase activating enzyme